MRKLNWLFAAAALLTGCTSIAPHRETDRFDYSTAIADSWKQQTLLNIVKLRYMDLPVFVDVASIVTGYSMQTGVNVNGTLSSKSGRPGRLRDRRAARPSTPTGRPSPTCR